MDRNTPTSFIPKSAITRTPEKIPAVVSLPTVVAVLFFLVSLGLFGGSYAYRRLLDNAINRPCDASSGAVRGCGLKESIDRARQDLDQATTVYLKRLNDKLLISSQALASHRTAVPIFYLLEELTLPSIYYTTLDYKGNTLSIDGRASSYEDIAAQTQVFARDRGRIKSFIFSDLDLDATNNVTFKLVINLEPEVTNYTQSLGGLPAPVSIESLSAQPEPVAAGTSTNPTTP